MPTITKAEAKRRLLTTKKICSADVERSGDKYVHRCVNCESETASHKGVRFCNACDADVATYRSCEAKEGDLFRMLLIPMVAEQRDAPMQSKNFTGKGKVIFNAADYATAKRILDESENIQVWKMGENVPSEDAAELRRMIATGDLAGVPRLLKFTRLKRLKIAGEVFDIEG
jgi:hypothetical protein